MRAVIQDRYGPPEVLRVAEVERPVPKDDEVLVRVYATTVTRGDAMGVRSAEYRFTRVFTGIRRPRRKIGGSEFAGRVEGVGAAVTAFDPATKYSEWGAAQMRSLWLSLNAERSRPSPPG